MRGPADRRRLGDGQFARAAEQSPSRDGEYAGDNGEIIGIDKYGASAPLNVVMEKYGFSTDNIAAIAKRVFTKVKGK